MTTKTATKKAAAAPASKGTPFGKPVKDEVFSFNIPEGSDGVIPDGRYEVKLVGLTNGESQAGNPMWTWGFIINKGKYKGMDFPVFTALTQAAMWKLQETLAAMGFTTKGGETVEFSKKDALGRLAIATIKQGTYKNRPVSQIDTLEPHDKGAGYKPVSSTGNPFVDGDVNDTEEDEAEEQEEVQEEVEEQEEGEVEEEEQVEEEAEQEEVEEEAEEVEEEAAEEVEEEDEDPPAPPARRAAPPAPARPAARPAARPTAPARPAPGKTVPKRK